MTKNIKLDTLEILLLAGTKVLKGLSTEKLIDKEDNSEEEK